MICPRCGDFIENSNQKFCAKCGYSFLNAEQQAQWANYRYQRIQDMNRQQRVPYPEQNVKKGLGAVPVFVIVFLIIVIIGVVFGIARGLMGESEDKSDRKSVREFANTTATYQTVTSTSTKAETKRTTKRTTTTTTTVQTTTEPQLEPITINETLVYDANNVKIYIKDIEDNVISFYIENNSDKNYNFAAHSYAVNGVMTRNNIYDMYCDVAANSKANAKLEIDKTFLKEFDVTTINTIDICFWAYDNAVSVKDFDTGCLRIITNKEEDIKVETKKNMYADNNISVDYIGRTSQDYKFCITNNRDNLIDFNIEDVTVNGYTITLWDLDIYDCEVLNNCQYVYTIHIDKEALKDNAIDKVETIQYNVKIRDNGDYFDDWATGNISVDID